MHFAPTFMFFALPFWIIRVCYTTSSAVHRVGAKELKVTGGVITVPNLRFQGLLLCPLWF